MGTVFLAENLDIGRPVALKVLHAGISRDPAMMARFRQEARASAAVDHPGVVSVLDLGQADDGSAFIVMERLEGETLGSRLEARGKLEPAEVLPVVIELLDAMAAAHHKGVIHRDLKPDNVFVTSRPRWGVKVLDFGISRVATEDLQLTASGTVMGTLLYMAPEQARDARAAGPAADLYAIGGILHHALVGRPPFTGGSYTEVLSALLTAPAAPIAGQVHGLPPALCTLVDRLLEKEPGDRPRSASYVRDALRAILAGEPVPAEATPSAVELDATMAPGAAPPPSLSTTVASIPPPLTAEIGPGPVAAAPTTTPAPPRRWRWVVLGLGTVGVAVAGVQALGGGAERAAVVAPAAGADAAEASRPTSVDAGLVGPRPQPIDARLAPPVDATAPVDAGAERGRPDARRPGATPASPDAAPAPPPIRADAAPGFIEFQDQPGASSR